LAAIVTASVLNCVLNASIVNRNCNLFATLADKLEITGEFVLAFNKFRPMITPASGQLLGTATERTDDPVKNHRGGGLELTELEPPRRPIGMEL
jgi:hypothetical protein